MAGHFRTVETWRGVLAFTAVAVFLQVLVGDIRPVDGGLVWRVGTEWGWSGPLELFLELGRAFPTAPP